MPLGGQSEVARLFPGHLVDHRCQTIHILDEEAIAAPLDDAEPGEAAQLARHGLAMGTDAARDLGVRRGPFDDCGLALSRSQPGKTPDLGLNTVADGQRAELVHARRERANFAYKLAQQNLRHCGLRREHVAEGRGRHGCDKTLGVGFDAGRARRAVAGARRAVSSYLNRGGRCELVLTLADAPDLSADSRFVADAEERKKIIEFLWSISAQ